MKKLFNITLLSLLTISTHALAGELVNKKTGEKVSFSLGTAELKVDGSKAGLPSRNMKLEKVSSYIEAEKQKNGATHSLFYMTDSFISFMDYETNMSNSITGTWVFCYLVPLVNIPTLGANVLDILALPVRLPIHLVKEGHAKKDTAKLQRAIFTNDIVEVSNKDFIRLKQYLD